MTALSVPARPFDVTPDVLAHAVPLVTCTSERSGWQHACDLARDVMGADLSIAIEFVGDDRAEVRSGSGFDDLAPGLVIPISPDSQAAAARVGEPCVSADLLVEDRFEPSGFLLREGVRSSISARFELGDGAALLGVHSRRPAFFDDADVARFITIVTVVQASLDRLRELGELRESASIDPLTGCLNRLSIVEHLALALDDDGRFAVLLIDLDGFKTVNDTLGHRAGDLALRIVARRIERSMGARGRLGRLGGDEFLVVLHESDGERLADRMIGHIEEVMVVEDSSVQLSASIGIARRRTGDDASTMLERADRLMYRAKSQGRGHVRADVIVDEAPTGAPARRRADDHRPSADQLDEALAGLRVVVQPIVDAGDQRIHGVEALCRGPIGHPLEAPDRLFEAARTYSRLGDLELEAKRLAFDLDLPADTSLYVNVEPALLCSESWMEQLGAIWRAGTRRSPVVVELTERSVLRSPGRLLEAVDACRSMGWAIALDDVGSRSESLAALRWIDPDVVKLDMSLLTTENTAHTAHVIAAISSHRSSNRRDAVRVIAEGVETLESARYAEVLGADLHQGYLYGRPAPIDELHTHVPIAMGDVDHPARTGPEERIATVCDLVRMSRHVESSALSPDCVIVASVQDARHVTERTRTQYEGLARRCGFVGLVGHGLNRLDDHHLAGVRLADVPADDPVTQLWHVVAISPTTSIGLVATEVEPSRTGARRFGYRMITDPAEVEAAARRLLRHF